MAKLRLSLLVVLIAACTGPNDMSTTSGPLPPPGGEVRTTDGKRGSVVPAADTATAPGPWEDYPEAPAAIDWPVHPLDDEQWVLVSAEFGCAGRSSQGDPDTHRRRVQKIAYHYKTTPRAVMDYGILLNNGDPVRAQNLGSRVRDTVGRCR